MVITIADLSQPEVAVYSRLTEQQLRNRLHPDDALFIAESPKVIRVALDAGMEPVSMLCERRHVDGDAADIVERLPDIPVYTADRDTLSRLTGYDLTRGVLCAMRRPAMPSVESVVHGARRVAVIDGVVDATNVGAIFRSAAAIGIDAVVVTRSSCDPLTRRAVRVSMGAVFLVPWARLDAPVHSLKALGLRTVALALTDQSMPIDHPALSAEERLAIILGSEGDGLPADTIARADYVARIPMMHGVDSLNVAAASAVAFWTLRAAVRR